MTSVFDAPVASTHAPLTQAQVRNFHFAQAFMALTHAHMDAPADDPHAGLAVAVRQVSDALAYIPRPKAFANEHVVRPVRIHTHSAQGCWTHDLLYEVHSGFILNAEPLLERLDAKGLRLTDEGLQLEALLLEQNRSSFVEACRFGELTLLRLPQESA